MQKAEAGGKGLLRARGYTPKAESPLLKKRMRVVEPGKENSPVLSGNSSSGAILEGDEAPTPKRRSMDLLARSTPNRSNLPEYSVGTYD